MGKKEDMDWNEFVELFLKPIIIAVLKELATILVLWLVWNKIAPITMGFKQIGFIEACGLLIICRILFRGKLIGAGLEEADKNDSND